MIQEKLLILLGIFVIWLVGYFITRVIYAKYGKTHFGIDYDGEKTYATMDDWDSNDSFYKFNSFIWPCSLLFALVYYSIKGLSKGGDIIVGIFA